MQTIKGGHTDLRIAVGHNDLGDLYFVPPKRLQNERCNKKEFPPIDLYKPVDLKIWREC